MLNKIEKEEKFLNMLGYKVEVNTKSNNILWNIIDENNNIVGTIRTKKLRNKCKKKELPAQFGYVTEINSDTTYYKDSRFFDVGNNWFDYEFDIKRDSGTDHVSMNCGEFPKISISSKEYGFMNFSILPNKFLVSFRSKTDNFNIEECVEYKWDEENLGKGYDCDKAYTYVIDYCDKNTEFSNSSKDGKTAQRITIKYNFDFLEKGQLEVEEKRWKCGNLKTNRKNIVLGTMKEAIEKQEMGIDAINHFRYMLNSILPFKQEIMEILLERIPHKYISELFLFFPDVIRKKEINEPLTLELERNYRNK